MFKADRCDLCGDCLTFCRWIEVGRDEAAVWIKDMIQGRRTPVPDRCITCYACNEICPHEAGPFDLIAELQEKYHTLLSEEKLIEQEERYGFSGELHGYPQGEKRIMSTCVFGKTDAHLIRGELYDLPKVGGKPYFCWVMMSHLGGESIQKKHAREFVDRLALTGAEEVVCFHDDCYAMLKTIAPEYGIEVPFRPVHLAEYLVEYLKAERRRIKPLNLDLAYQRPCASRWTPEKEHFIDELFDLVGVRRVERRFDRDHAMCCAGIKFLLDLGDPIPDQVENIRDAKDAGAQGLVCLCPMCMHSLSNTAGELEIPLIFLGDLARRAVE